MINIIEKNKCCGCEACAQICPQKCIQLLDDVEGYIYPYVNHELCINCGLCEQRCPLMKEHKPQIPIDSLGAVNNDECVVKSSSSGGIFSALAGVIIKRGGVVFGASYNDIWAVEHILISDLKSLDRVRGSKYVQSRINNSYQNTYNFLQKGRKVLFSGTPCQIAGLKSFLRKEYDNLLTVEVACHGVPSPLVFKDYLDVVSKRNISNITSISFRDKQKGWLNYRFVIKSKIKGKEKVIVNDERSNSMYLQSFLRNYNLRPSCYQCVFKSGCSGADITLADFWGVWKIVPNINYENGVSAVLVNTIKGRDFLNSIDIIKFTVNYNDVVKYNSCLKDSSREPENRYLFWDYWQKRDYRRINKLVLPSIKTRIKRIIKQLFE